MVSALIDLLQKGKSWTCDEAYVDAFDKIKSRLVAKLVLKLLDFDKSFEIHTNASNHTVGGVLVQNGHLVAFESWKLKSAKQHYSTHEKEMLVVMHCLRVWRVYLLGTSFVIKIGNIANTFFKNQKKLPQKQAHW